MDSLNKHNRFVTNIIDYGFLHSGISLDKAGYPDLEAAIKH